MQDSLEDYIRISKSKEESKTGPSKEVLVTAQIKKECEDRAMKIVEFLIDGKLREQVFLKSLPNLNQAYYQDIVEERAISNLCGYPICGKKIPDMPKKQYYISTRENKVYDITERKNFCSNFCYKASLHIKNQIDTSPLWLRNRHEIPQFNLLPSSERGLVGEVVDQGVVKSTEATSFTSVSSFTDVSLTDIIENEITAQKKKKIKNCKLKSLMNPIEEAEEAKEKEDEATCAKNNKNKTHICCRKPDPHVTSQRIIKRLKNFMNTIKEDEEFKERENEAESQKEKIEKIVNIEICNDRMSEETKENLKVDVNSIISDCKKEMKSKEDITEKLKRIANKIKQNNKVSKINFLDQAVVKKVDESAKTKANKPKAKVDSKLESEILKAVKEWLTLETFLFIYGEKKVKDILNERKLSKYFDELKIAELQREQQQKYIEICQKLQLTEMVEEKFDNAVLGNSSLQPLPDYKQLKAENKELDLKVKSFYTGSLYEMNDTNFPIKDIQAKEEEDGGPDAVLPLVDVNAQTALRRRIFSSSINKAMLNLLKELNINSSTVMNDLGDLVRTFNLKADNIVFKTTVWGFVAVVLLKMLSLQNSVLQEVLNEDRSVEYINVLLESLPNKDKIVTESLKVLENIDVFIEEYIKSADPI